MRACWRCRALNGTVRKVGVLWLCDGCAVGTFCGMFRHRYIASETSGILVCLACGSLLSGSPISTDIVEAPGPETFYVEC